MEKDRDGDEDLVGRAFAALSREALASYPGPSSRVEEPDPSGLSSRSYALLGVAAALALSLGSLAVDGLFRSVDSLVNLALLFL